MAAEETTVEIAGEEVRISSPSRVVFPQRGWTKLDVVSHFAVCAEGALRGVANRPTMLKRYMKGVEQPPIYQKRAKRGSPFQTVSIRFPSQRPGVMNVPISRADIIRLAQLGCLDFHPWPVRADDIDHPDELRLDFDPTPGFRVRPSERGGAGVRHVVGGGGTSGVAQDFGQPGDTCVCPDSA